MNDYETEWFAESDTVYFCNVDEHETSIVKYDWQSHHEKFDKQYNFSSVLVLGDINYNGARNIPPVDYSPIDVTALLKTIKDKCLFIRGNCDSRVDEFVLEKNFFDGIITNKIFEKQNFNKLNKLLDWAWHVLSKIMQKTNAFIPEKVYNIDVNKLFAKLK